MSLVSVFQELEQEPQARETLKRLEQHLQVRLEQLAPRAHRTLQPTLNSSNLAFIILPLGVTHIA